MKIARTLAVVTSAVLCGCTGSTPVVPSGTYDAGYIFPDATPKFTHVFTVRNPFDRPVAINGLRRSCSCTDATFEKKTLQPGETGELLVSVRPPHLLSSQNIVAIIQTDQPKMQDWTYTLTFRSIPRVRFEQEAISLGEFPTSTAKTRLSSPNVARKVYFETYVEEGKHSPPPVLQVDRERLLEVDNMKQEGVKMIEGGKLQRTRYSVEVKLREPAFSEIGTRTLSLSAAIPAIGTASCLVTWSTTAEIAVSPSPLSFGLVNGRPSITKKLIISSKDGTSFKVTSATSDFDGLNIQIIDPERPAPFKTIRTILTPKANTPARSLNGQIVISTNHPSVSSVSVPWTALGSVGKPPLTPQRLTYLPGLCAQRHTSRRRPQDGAAPTQRSTMGARPGSLPPARLHRPSQARPT